MGIVYYAGKRFSVEAGQTVLDGLLEHGAGVQHGCRNGICQACLLRLDSSNLQAESSNIPVFQDGLTEEQKTTGLFLACKTVIASESDPLHCDSADRAGLSTALVYGKEWLNKTVIKVTLKVDALSWLAGQYITLSRNISCARSYSIANPFNEEGLLEIHIRHYPDGEFSHWVATELSVGETLELRGPMGSCIYNADRQRPLLLVSMGTGLAPIVGILRDALTQFHQGRIQLIAAASSLSKHYYVDQLTALCRQNSNMSLQFLLPPDLNDVGSSLHSQMESVVSANVYDYTIEKFNKDPLQKIYLCGGEQFVGKLRKQLFLAGADLKDIVSDAFLQFGTS